MTAQPISHALSRRDASRGIRFAASPKPHVPYATHCAALMDALFKPGALRVAQQRVAVAPAGVAGLMLACVSIAACRQAESRPLALAPAPRHASSAVVVPALPSTTGVSVFGDADGAPKKGTHDALALHGVHTKYPTASVDDRVAANTDSADGAMSVAASNEPASSTSSTLPAESATALNAEAPAFAPPPAAVASSHAAVLPRADALPEIMRTWAAWGVPAVAVIVVCAAVALTRRRRRRKQADADAPKVIGWKGWKYDDTAANARAAFFGAEVPELPQVWPIRKVQLEERAEHGSIRPATDGRYGLLKPVRPLRVSLSLEDDAFVHWSTTDGVSSWETEPATSAQGALPLSQAMGEHVVTEIDADVPNEVADAYTHAEHVIAAQAQPTVDHDGAARHTQDHEAQQGADAANDNNLRTRAEAHHHDAINREALAQEQAPEHNNQDHSANVAAEALRLKAAEREALARADALRREAEEREANAHAEALRQEALERETQARAEEERRAAAEREAHAQAEALRRQAEALAAQQHEAQRRKDEALALQEALGARRTAVMDAKKQLTMGHPHQALATLSPVLSAPNVSGEAWTVAGWSWWRIARDNGHDAAHAAGEAIRAFRAAMVAEPERESLLGSALIRCHLFMADHLQGQARATVLDAALALMHEAAGRRSGDSTFISERAHALYERALLSSSNERAALLDQARQALSQLPSDDDDARNLLVSIVTAQAEGLQGRTADALFARATDLLKQTLRDAAPDMHDHWLARLIDVELMRLRQLKAAARVMHLRHLRDTYASELQQARSAAPLLSWIMVLREWAAMLSERPAREKLAEVEAMLLRIEALAPEDIGSVHFARAYYLRLRAAHEPAGPALEALDAADALLATAQSPVLVPETIALERAEVAMMRARFTKGVERTQALARAATLADAAVSVNDGNLPSALTCAITARLSLAEEAALSASDIEVLETLATRLLDVLPHQAGALQLAARCASACGRHADAVRLCEACWQAGSRDSSLLRLWRLALERSNTSSAQDDLPWKRFNQCVRTAQSIGQSVR